MTTEPPKVNLQGRYPIGKAAKLLGISRTTLLRHTKSEDIRYKTSQVSNRKVFTGSDIMAYWLSNA